MINNKALQDALLKNKNIHVVPAVGIDPAFVVKKNNEYFIAVDSSLTDDALFWVIEHELAHIETDTLYFFSSDAYNINKNEKAADAYLVSKNQLKTKIKKAQADGLSDNEIMAAYGLSSDVYAAALYNINLERLKCMTNCVNLLCLRDGLSPSMLASMLGISLQDTMAIINEQAILDYITITKLCDIFSVDPAYILCV